MGQYMITLNIKTTNTYLLNMRIPHKKAQSIFQYLVVIILLCLYISNVYTQENDTIAIMYKPYSPKFNTKFSTGDYNNHHSLFRITSIPTDVQVSYQILIRYKDNQDPLYDTLLQPLEGENNTVYVGLKMGYDTWYRITDNALLDLQIDLYNSVDKTLLYSQTFEVEKTPHEYIHTWYDLQNMSENLSASYILQNDIVFPTPGEEGFPFWGFIPIGTETEPFIGSLQGNSYKIIGLYIDNFTLKHGGLFAKIQGITEANTALEDMPVVVSNIVFQDSIVKIQAIGGIVAGYVETAAIESIAVIGSGGIETQGEADVGGSIGAYTGGIVGIINEGKISDVSNTSEFVRGAKATIGGIAGYAENSDIIAHMSAKITGSNLVGGIVGSSNNSRVYGYSTTEIFASRLIGGLVGYAHGSIIIGHYTGNITADWNIGGLVGEINDSTVRGYVRGNIIGNGSWVGGLIGKSQKGTIYGYAEGLVRSTNNYVGGLVGAAKSGEIIGYSTNNVYGRNSVGGLVGRSDSISIQGYALGYIIGERDISLGIGNKTGINNDIIYVGRTKDEQTIEANKQGGGDHIANSKKNFEYTGVVLETVNSNDKNMFSEFSFTDIAWEWSLENDALWPTLNVPTTISDTYDFFIENYVQSPKIPPVPPNFIELLEVFYKPYGEKGTNTFSLGDYNNSVLFKAIEVLESMPQYKVTFIRNKDELVIYEQKKQAVSPFSTKKQEIDMGITMPYTIWQDMEELAEFTVIVEVYDNTGEILTHKGIFLVEKTGNNEIYSWHGLQNMKDNLSLDYILQKDIVFPPPGNKGFPNNGFIPIGTVTQPFLGTLDGNSKEIIGLYIKDESLRYAGLFGAIKGPNKNAIIIKDLSLRTVSIQADAVIGSIAGSLEHATIKNVSTKGLGSIEAIDEYKIPVEERRGRGAYTGGLVGYGNSIVLQDVYNEIAVTGNYSFIGGLVGFIKKSEVSGYVNAAVSGIGGVGIGGIVGAAIDSNITGHHLASVEGQQYVGGLVGTVSNSVIRGYTTGNITGKVGVGGISGQLTEKSVLYGYTTGNITGTSSIGGVVGATDKSTVQGYATGTITGDGLVGGLSGLSIASTVRGYIVGDVNGFSRVGGLVGGANKYSVVQGYMLGHIRGFSRIGGLVGVMESGTLIGYMQGNVTGKDNAIGGLVGVLGTENIQDIENLSVIEGYMLGYVRGLKNRGIGIGQNYLDDDSVAITIYAGRTAEEEVAELKSEGSGDHIADGIGNSLYNGFLVEKNPHTEASFKGFTFGSGDWEWKHDTELLWPILNTPDTISNTDI